MNDLPAPNLPAAGWYPDPEQAQTQRYWDGEAWTDQRAPGKPRSPVAAPPQWVIFTVAGLVIVLLGLLYFRGSLDGMLSHVGLNYTPCAELLLTGERLCGDDLETACRERFFAQANAAECRKVL